MFPWETIAGLLYKSHPVYTAQQLINNVKPGRNIKRVDFVTKTKDKQARGLR